MFQFPMGWNSTVSKELRDTEVLPFQFPMGWNSTVAMKIEGLDTIVSIPNGMEFYA